MLAFLTFYQQLNMPRRLWLQAFPLIALPLMLTMGCGKIRNEVKKSVFNGLVITAIDQSFEIPEIPVAGPEATISNIAIPFNMDSVIRANTGGSFGLSDVGIVNMDDVTMYMQNPDTPVNMANFETVRLSLTTNTLTQPVLVEYRPVPDVYAASLVFPIDKTKDLRPYASGSTLFVALSSKLRRPTNRTLYMRLIIKLKLNPS